MSALSTCFRDPDTLELCATEGLRPTAVHETRLRFGEGLVGKVARLARPLKSANAPSEPGFRYMPETGEEVFTSFLGVPVQRLGERLGVLVVQSKEARDYSEDEIYGLEVVAMVIAEMTELGAFVGEGTSFASPHKRAASLRGVAAQEGEAEGYVWLHQPRVVVTNLVNDDSKAEIARLHEAVDKLRGSVDDMPQRGAVARQRTPRGFANLPHVRQFARLDEADGRRHPPWAYLPKPLSRKSNPPRAPGWKPCRTSICATGCMIWMTCRTGCCAF